MKIKFGLFILFLIILLVPTMVFAQTQKACDNYGDYIWEGYAIVAKGDKSEKMDTVSENDSIRKYFNDRFATGTIHTPTGDVKVSDISGIWLYFKDKTGNKYSSQASVTTGFLGFGANKIQCTGKVKLVGGVTSIPVDVDDPLEIIKMYTCKQLESTELYNNVLNPAYKYIRVAVPCLLLLLCSYDFTAAVVANDDDKMKKAQSRVLKRIVIGIVLFVLPNLINALLTLLGDYGTCSVGL